jgi:exopolysaccharide biosynthesis polyprenyl glycosylphosphotransferase
MQVHDGGDTHGCRQTSSSLRIAFPLQSETNFSGKRVLLIGTGALLSQALDEAGAESRPAYIVGMLDSKPGTSRAVGHAGVPVLGDLEDIEAVVAEQCIDEIRAVMPERRITDKLPVLEATAQALGVPITFYFPAQDQHGAIPRFKADRGKLVVHRDEHPSNRGGRGLVKRGIDVLVSGIALLLLAPLLALIAIAIKLTSPGPVLFHQQRIGTWRRQFRMLKFRTMLKDAELLRERIREQNNARGISFKVFDDPRITPVGSFLRRTSLDELPQLVNVFLGDMTLVGPRPIPVFVAEQMQGSAYLRRFSVKQGLTGLWQVEGRQQDFDYMSTQDLRYVDNWSLSLDFKILLRTLPAVIRGNGAH